MKPVYLLLERSPDGEGVGSSPSEIQNNKNSGDGASQGGTPSTETKKEDPEPGLLKQEPLQEGEGAGSLKQEPVVEAPKRQDGVDPAATVNANNSGAEPAFKNYNIKSEDDVMGQPGEKVTFTVGIDYHTKDGKESPLGEGNILYIYEDNEWVRVVSVDKSADFEHKVTVAPINEEYPIHIRAGKQILISHESNSRRNEVFSDENPVVDLETASKAVSEKEIVATARMTNDDILRRKSVGTTSAGVPLPDHVTGQGQ